MVLVPPCGWTLRASATLQLGVVHIGFRGTEVIQGCLSPFQTQALLPQLLHSRSRQEARG